MTICIFPGTFNPIHLAHLRMAQFAVQKYGFERVIFVPSYIPPHKSVDSNLAKHRYNMVKMAVERNLRFGISDIEYKSEGKSYTLITVKKLKELYKVDGRLNLLIGADAFRNIKTWYKADELKDLVHFIVFPRGEDIIYPDDYNGYSYELVNSDTWDISSTEIRTNLSGETTKEVKEYIQKHDLYR